MGSGAAKGGLFSHCAPPQAAAAGDDQWGGKRPAGKITEKWYKDTFGSLDPVDYDKLRLQIGREKRTVRNRHFRKSTTDAALASKQKEEQRPRGSKKRKQTAGPSAAAQAGSDSDEAAAAAPAPAAATDEQAAVAEQIALSPGRIADAVAGLGRGALNAVTGAWRGR